MSSLFSCWWFVFVLCFSAVIMRVSRGNSKNMKHGHFISQPTWVSFTIKKCSQVGPNWRISKTMYLCISSLPQNLFFYPQSILFPLNMTLLKLSSVPKKMKLWKILYGCRATICPGSGCHMLHLKISKEVCLKASLVNWAFGKNFMGLPHFKICTYLI